MSKLHRSEFLREVKIGFPEVIDKINKEEGLLSFEIDIFVTFIQSLIDLSALNRTELALSILDKYYRDGNKALHELIRNAVCEDLVFTDTKNFKRSWAYDLLSEPLITERKAWFKFMGYRGI